VTGRTDRRTLRGGVRRIIFGRAYAKHRAATIEEHFSKTY